MIWSYAQPTLMSDCIMRFVNLDRPRCHRNLFAMQACITRAVCSSCAELRRGRAVLLHDKRLPAEVLPEKNLRSSRLNDPPSSLQTAQRLGRGSCQVWTRAPRPARSNRSREITSECAQLQQHTYSPRRHTVQVCVKLSCSASAVTAAVDCTLTMSPGALRGVLYCSIAPAHQRACSAVTTGANMLSHNRAVQAVSSRVHVTATS